MKETVGTRNTRLYFKERRETLEIHKGSERIYENNGRWGVLATKGRKEAGPDFSGTAPWQGQRSRNVFPMDG